MAQIVKISIASLLVLTLLSATGTAVADNDKEAKRLQQKMNALQQNKLRVEGQLKEMTEQLELSKQSVEAANRKGNSLAKALKTIEREKVELAEKLATSEQKLAETLLQSQDTKNQLEASLSTCTQNLAACTTKNESLHRLGVELIKQYQEKSCLSSVLQNEPLTQLKSTDIENMVEEYREKLDQELVNQQRDENRCQGQEKADVKYAELEKSKTEETVRLKAEQEKAESVKATQQGSLDRLTRKVISFFEDTEW